MLLFASWTLHPASRDVHRSLLGMLPVSTPRRENDTFELGDFFDSLRCWPSINTDLVVFCNTSLNSASTFEDIWTVWMVGT